MKKILSHVIAVIIIISAFTPLVSAQNVYSVKRSASIMENVRAFLDCVDDRKEIVSSVNLFNPSDTIEAIFYQLSYSGYIVASYKDGHIIEYSPDDLSESLVEISKTQRLYYGGVLLFCVKFNDKYQDIITDEIIDGSGFYSIDYCDTVPELHFGTAFNNQTRDAVLSPPINYGSASGGYYCTITGIANLLQYYKDYFNADVYSGNVTNYTGMRSALCNDHYVYNGPLYLSNAVSNHVRNFVFYNGLYSYLHRNDVTNYYVSIHGASLSNVVQRIGTYARPVLLTINTSSLNSQESGMHIVLCYGYWETSTTTYYIVNDTWGHNSVYICADDVPSGYELLELS